MKTQIKRLSKNTLAVLLSVCLLISCMTVGIIATDAAKTAEDRVGAVDDSEALGYSLQDGARIYFDASKSGFTGSNVYVGFLYNKSGSDWWDCYIMKMSHVSNSKIYTIQTYSVSNSTCDDLFFFSSNTDYGTQRYNNNAQWSWNEAKIYENIKNNKADGGYSLTGGWNVYNYHTYYYSCTSATPGAAVTQENDLTGSSASDENKSPYKYNVFKHDQSANVYLGTDYVGDSNTTVGGRIQMSGRYWSGAYAVSSQGNASSGSETTYRTYSNAARGTTAEASVLETFSGYSFDGWYNSSNELLSTDTTYSYTVTGANSIRARFSVDAAYDYFVTSAGSDDDTKGFTDSIWVANDSEGGMSADSSVSGYDYSKTFTGVPVGTYRFKITNGTWTSNWGDNGSIDYTEAGNTSNQGKENNGNAKFDLTKASDVTIYFNSTSHAIKVKTTDAAVGDKYYIVGQASDGTRGMFANVWANNWTSFSSADEITVSGGAGSKVYTDFAGTTGTYTYKVIKVGASGIVQYFPNDGDGNTVNVTSRTTSVTFSVTTDNDGVITAVTATPAEGSGGGGTIDFDKTGYNVESNAKVKYSSTNSGYWDGVMQNRLTTAGATVYKKGDFEYWIEFTGADLTAFKSNASGTYFNLFYSSSSQWSKDDYKDVIDVTTHTNSSGITASMNNYSNSWGAETRNVEFAVVNNLSNATALGLYVNTQSGNRSMVYYTAVAGEDVEEVEIVDIYAKNGTLRDNTFNRFTNLADTDIVSITDPDGIVHTPSDWETAAASWATGTAEWDNNVSGYNSDYVKVTKVPVGSKIKLRTYLSGNASDSQVYQSGKSFAETHYLKAYSINGNTYKLHTASEAQTATTGYKFTSGDKYYEEEWTVEKVNTTNMKNGNTIEITPIYYMTDNSNTKTFYIDGYIGELQTNWGTMLSVYPYYEGKSNKANAFGGYPGQPMLYWGGKYQMEVPLTVDGTASGAQVKGLTLHNGYWDLLHRALDTKCADSHCQTYDYDDFYKLYKEKNADTIYFWFKYRNRSANDNFGDGYEYTDYDFVTDTEGADDIGSTPTITTIEGKNGAEIITDYYGRQVSLFGDLIDDGDKSTYVGDSPTLKGNELLIVSTGYKDTYVGEYGTIWAVYTQPTMGNFNFLGYISSSMLYLNSINSVNQYTGGTSTDQGRMSWSEFKNTYNTLKTTYKDVPAIISYEKEIWNDSKDKAYRSDGKWFYSMGNDKITANIKIQYTSKTDATLMDETANWTDDPFDNSVTGYGGEKNVGTNTRCSAYFTNTTPDYLVGKTVAEDILVDNNKHFTFQAASGGTYEFVGWVRECGGEQNAIASTNGLGESNISSNDTYIARFKPVSSGKLVISHNITQDSTHKGNGTKYLKVQVYDGTTLKREYVSTDGSDVDVSDYIKSNTTSYKIKVTLTTVPDEDCTVVTRTCTPDNSAFKTDAFTPTAGVTLTQTKEFNVSDVFNGTASTVTAIRYLTALTKTEMTYNYAITYHYTSRFWGEQSYYVSGTVADERYSAQFFTGTKSGARLTDEFIKNSTPYEKNFRQKINWNYTSSVVGGAAAMTKGCSSSVANVYDLTAEVWSANTVNDEVKAEFLLPYKYVSENKSADPLPVYTADGTVTENTEYAFDEDSYESFTLTSQVGRLFQYDNTVPDVAQASDHASQYKLVEAAPYVLYKSYDPDTDKITPVDFHHKKVSSKRYYTGDSFTVDGTTYYLNKVPSGAPAGSQALTEENTVTVNKPEKAGQSGYQGTTYDFAVQAADGRVYFFAYALDNNDEPAKVDGQFVFNGQYVVYSENDVIDGIVQGDYTKKYFTRWDIFNSNGVKVASSYYRQFNYSGYENYTIKPVYTSDEPTAATFDENEGSDGIAATISYLGDSRNQWKGSSTSDMTARGEYNNVTHLNDATYAGDKMFADFAIAYNYNDQQLSTISSTSETIKIGMVIEKLNTVKTVNGKVVTDPNYYQGLAEYNQFDVTDMQNYILSKVATGHSYSGRPNSKDKTYGEGKGSSYGVTHVAIGSNVNGFAGNETSTLLFGEGTPMLDNKNRLQYFYTFTKSKNDFENLSENPGNSRPYDCVYRVSSYIYVNNGSKETVRVSAPIYITLYDTATRKGG